MIRRGIPAMVIVAGVGGLVLGLPRDPAWLTGVLLLLCLLVDLWIIWQLRPRRATATLPPPPWQPTPPRHWGQATIRWRARWRLAWLLCSAALLPPPRLRLRRTIPFKQCQDRPKASPPRRSPRPRRWRPPFPQRMPTLAIEFVTPDPRPLRPVNAPGTHAPLLQQVTTALAATEVEPPPTVLALHDQPRQVLFQLAPTVLLSSAQQRAVVAALQSHGVVARWRDEALLAVRQNSRRPVPGDTAPTAAAPLPDACWVPVLHKGQTTLWWPLPRQQHLLLAGSCPAALASILPAGRALPDQEAPPLLIHDPDGWLREQSDQLGHLIAQPDALHQARQRHFQYCFVQARTAVPPAWVPPVCLIVAPSTQLWPEVQPLLAAESGVQVVLIIGQRPPIAPLRALCYQLPVIEHAPAGLPPLPATFRPAGVPVPRPNETVAWMLGGRVWWRGQTPAIPTGEDAP